jgi:hypothetical protein
MHIGLGYLIASDLNSDVDFYLNIKSINHINSIYIMVLTNLKKIKYPYIMKNTLSIQNVSKGSES